MPSAPFVVPPLLLIAILLVSAVAKVRDPGDTLAVFRQLELPEWLVTVRAPQLLPYAELVVAALLLVTPGGWYVAAATLGLLLFAAYFAVILRALRLPYGITCSCFGRLGLGYVTRRTAVRNTVLLAVAVVTLADSFRGRGVLQRVVTTGDQAWWLAAVALTAVVVGVVVREEVPEQLPEARDAEPDGSFYVPTPIPYVLLDGPAGPTSVWELSDAAARLLVFADPADPSGAAAVARVPSWAETLAPVQVHVVAEETWPALAGRFPAYADRLLGDPERALRDGLAVASPGAVLLGTDRLLAGGPVDGLDEIEDLVEAAAEELRAAAP